MKRLFVVLFIFLLAIPAFTQIKLGIKAGAATTTVPTYDFTTGSNNIEALKDAAWGFHAGLFLRLTLLGIYLQPEALFATNTYEYNVTMGTNPAILKEQTFNKLEVPVLLGFKFGPLRINAGPAAAVQIGNPKALLEDPDFEEMYKGATFGYQAGIGLDLFKKLTLDARYGGSLSKKFGEAVTIGTQTFKLDQRQPSLILSVGLMF
ncbi:MAG: porin family protein [Bacteroidales bacterium]